MTPQASQWPVSRLVPVLLAAAIALLLQVQGSAGGEWPVMIPLYAWMPAGPGTVFNVEFLVDPLAAVMLVTVTGVALLVVAYSRDYMRHHDHPERGYERFFAFLALFVFAMCSLVLGGNFLRALAALRVKRIDFGKANDALADNFKKNKKWRRVVNGFRTYAPDCLRIITHDINITTIAIIQKLSYGIKNNLFFQTSIYLPTKTISLFHSESDCSDEVTNAAAMRSGSKDVLGAT